jgi:hypothetical protein
MTDIRLTAGLAALLTALCGASAAAPVEAPPGWSLPAPADLTGEDAASRRASPSRYLSSTADFNGDGKADEARILVNRSAVTYGVFIFPGGAEGPTKLHEGPLAEVSRTGIATAAAGAYRPACADGAGPDGACEPATVQIAASGLRHFTFEAGARVFYWDGSRYAVVDIAD